MWALVWIILGLPVHQGPTVVLVDMEQQCDTQKTVIEHAVKIQAAHGVTNVLKCVEVTDERAYQGSISNGIVLTPGSLAVGH